MGYKIGRHTELIEKEAISTHLLEAKESVREKQREVKVAVQEMQRQVDQRDQERQAARLKDILAWLSEDQDQEPILEKLSRVRHAHICEWLIRNQSIVSWIHGSKSKPIIWLFSMPGSGRFK